MTFYQKIELPYGLNELEPFFSRENLHYHYNVLHDNYEKKLNETLERLPSFSFKRYPNLRDLLKSLEIMDIPENIRKDINFFGGGLINHDFFFSLLAKNNDFVNQNLLRAIVDNFGSLENLKSELIESALKIRGSGWTWLIILVKKDKKEIRIINTSNQDSPFSAHEHHPLIGIDVWEHAFSDYQKFGKQAKEEYLKVVVNKCLNWDFINNLYINLLI